MENIKVNIYISYADKDRKSLDLLLKWLYPMRDEVNIWYRDYPTEGPGLSLPWRMLLFWYRPPAWQNRYAQVLHYQMERAHIYIHLTSPASLLQKDNWQELNHTIDRRVEGDWRSPRIFPLVIRSCDWRSTPLGAYPPLVDMKPLAEHKKTENPWPRVIHEIAQHIKFIQPILHEVKHYKYRAVEPDTLTNDQELLAPRPDLGEDPGSVEFELPTAFSPPTWLGWSIIAFIFIGALKAFHADDAIRKLDPYRHIQSANPYQPEFRREVPLSPPADTAVVWPVED